MQLQRWSAKLVRAALGIQETEKSLERCRPDGFLIWFQVETADQGYVALPVITRCTEGLRGRADFQVVVTAHKSVCPLLHGVLPQQVTLLETHPGFVSSIRTFLGQWQPNVAVFMDSELQPGVLNACRDRGVWLAWLDARMPTQQFLHHQACQKARTNISKLLYMFDLILPETDVDVARMVVLGGVLAQMPAWYVELSYAQALEACGLLAVESPTECMKLLQEARASRPVWLAANTTSDETVDVAVLHHTLKARFSTLLTVMVPKEAALAKPTLAKLKAQGLQALLWSELSQGCQCLDDCEVVVVDVAGLLPQLYKMLEVVFMGDSLAEDARGSRLHEAAAAGCAVVTGSCSGMFMEVADLNQAALRAAEEWDLTAESPMSTSGQEEPRCQNPTPRRAAGPPENGFGSDPNIPLPRIRTVPEDEAIEDTYHTSSSTDLNSEGQQSMTAPASLSHNWRFSPINSPAGSPVEAVATARSLGVGGGWRRTTSLRRTGSVEIASNLMTDRSMGTLERVPLSVVLRRTGSTLSNQGHTSDNASPSNSRTSDTTLFTARWPTVHRYESESVMPVWQLPQHPRGPAVWQIQSPEELKDALELLLAEPVQRRSQGHAAVQAAAKIGNGMLTIAWEVFVIMVLEPALAGMQTRATSQASQAAGLLKQEPLVEDPLAAASDASDMISAVPVSSTA